jgi:hypothetical protein
VLKVSLCEREIERDFVKGILIGFDVALGVGTVAKPA